MLPMQPKADRLLPLVPDRAPKQTKGEPRSEQGQELRGELHPAQQKLASLRAADAA